MYKRLQISGLITHVQADVISVEAIPMALREHLLQTPSVLTNHHHGSSQTSKRTRRKSSRRNRNINQDETSGSKNGAHHSLANSESLDEMMTRAELDEIERSHYDELDDDNDDYDDDDDEEEEEDDDLEDEDNLSESNSSSLVIEPSNVLTNEDVMAMPELRDVLQNCHPNHPQQRPGEMVVLVDETYEFGECENCMDEEDEDDDEDNEDDEDDDDDENSGDKKACKLSLEAPRVLAALVDGCKKGFTSF